jgi:hypothetical protein
VGVGELRKRLDGIFIWSYEVWQLRESPDFRNDPVDYGGETRD